MDKDKIKRITGAGSDTVRAIRLDASLRRPTTIPNKKTRYRRKPKHPRKDW